MKIILSALTVGLCGVGLVACGSDGNTGGGKQNPSASLIEVDTEAAGDDCEHGGTRIRVGVDADGDGVLQSEEVTSTQYVCAPAPGEGRTLFETETEPAGANCEHGGAKLSSGVDEDGDGVLDEDEVSQEQYVCSDVDGVVATLLTKVHFGNVEIRTEADLEAIQPYEMILGWLDVHSDSVPSATFPNLKRVTNSIDLTDSCSDNLILKSVSFPALTEAGDIYVDGGCDYQSWIEELSFPVLRQVGDLYINRALLPDASLELPQLTFVLEDIGLYELELTSLSLPALTTVGDDIWLENNPGLTSVSAPQLSAVHDEIGIWSNNSLTSVSFPLLTRLGYGLYVEDNPVLESFTIGSIEEPLEELEFEDNPQLSSCTAYVLAGQMLNVGNDEHWISGGLPCANVEQRCPEIQNLGSGRAYRLCFGEPETFDDARALCQSIDGFDLPTFADGDDLDALEDALDNLNVTNGYWAGYFYDDEEGTWSSIDATPLDGSVFGSPSGDDAAGLVTSGGPTWDYSDETYPVLCRAVP